MRYRGGEGQWSWLLHRVSGLGVLLFLLSHIVETSLLSWGPEVYNASLQFFHHPYFRIGHVALAAALLFHALNGLRIALIDFWPGMTRHHRSLFWGVMVLFIVLFIPSAWIIIRPLFAQGV